MTVTATDDTGVDAEEAARPALRYGWVAKGFLFVIIGALAVEISRQGFSRKDADQAGALATLADAPAGRILVGAVSVGLLLYAVWQVWAAVVQESDGVLHLLKRIGWVGLALVYGLLAVTGLQIALDGGSSSGGAAGSGSDQGPTSPTGLTARLFEVPGGRLLVAAVGIGTAVVGLYQLVKGAKGDFFDDIESDDLSGWHRLALRTMGTVGFAARALVLGIAGWLFVDAARRYDPERAAGIDQSLRILGTAPLGRVLLAVCGIGLAAAGLYDIITHRRQRIDEVA